jgi:hypothetical protein
MLPGRRTNDAETEPHCSPLALLLIATSTTDMLSGCSGSSSSLKLNANASTGDGEGLAVRQELKMIQIESQLKHSFSNDQCSDGKRAPRFEPDAAISNI